MAAKDHHHKRSPLVSALAGVLPPLCISILALWFFCFLWEHANPRIPPRPSSHPGFVVDRHHYRHRGRQNSSNEVETEGYMEIPIVDDDYAERKGSDAGVRNGVAVDAKWKINGHNVDAHGKKSRNEASTEGSRISTRCDISSGRWVLDKKKRRTAYNESCRDIFKGWNCLHNNKPNAEDILAWRWQPQDCTLPALNATLFLDRFQNKRIGFVGDSLNRNMYVSLACSLKQASSQVRKWRPAGADKAITFLDYNLTLAYHRTNLLARYGPWEAKSNGELESLGYKQGFRVDVDIPQSTWEEAPHFHDVLVLNTGHWWWAPEKFDPMKTPMIFFEKGEPIIPTKSPEEGLDLVLKNMLAYIDKEMRPNTLKFLRTQSPRHFEGGDWNEGGKCHREKPLSEEEANTFFSLKERGPNVEMALANMHLKKSIEGTSFHLLNISYLSSLRADAHPSLSAGKQHEDCMHWCLPGVTDVWNDMFVWYLLQPLQQQ